ncbi:lytic transglycosylase [Shewanella sp. NFH-SH190041]|nr:lytic transglycosylase [Shewanella sp. NFH-SH190041]
MVEMKWIFILWLGLFVSVAVYAEPENNSPSFQLFLQQTKQQLGQKYTYPSQWLDSQFSTIKRFYDFRPAKTVTDEPLAFGHITLEHYLPARFTSEQIEYGAQLLVQHGALLQRLQQQYGVQPRFLVALWGALSNYALSQDAYPMLSVVASKVFAQQLPMSELIAALDLVKHFPTQTWVTERQGVIAPIGFSPSRLQQFGQDGNGDGVLDIRHSVADMLASLAYFLQQQGWQAEQTWGRQVKLPALFKAEYGMAHSASFAYWQNLGVRRFDGGNLPKRQDMQISLLRPDGATGRHYLVYDNYRALYAWQNDHYFALSVSYLSERLKLKFRQLKK